jgi:hypothetical protein
VIWDPNLGGDMGPLFGILIWGFYGTPLWDPDLGGDMGAPFGTLIWVVIFG